MHFPSIIEYLASKPDGDGLAQHIVLQGVGLPTRCGSIVSTFDTDGRTCLIGSFGIDRGLLSRFAHMPLWERLPWTDAIRSGDPILLPTPDEVRQRYPIFEHIPDLVRPSVSWPLGHGLQRIGALHLQFADGDVQAVSEALQETVALVALYLQLNELNHQTDGDAAAESRVGSGTPFPNGGLTERQRQVLEYMAAGCTNAQIGKSLGFSESTVKQETMRVFRYLGVHDRRSAVLAAQQRTLLPTG